MSKNPPGRNSKSTKGETRGNKSWTDYDFVTIDLSDAQKAHFKALTAEETDELSDSLGTLLELEYKVSFAGDNRNDCIIASLTCRREADDNYGYVLSSRASTWYEAMMLCAFKHLFCCENGVWPKEKRQTNWG